MGMAGLAFAAVPLYRLFCQVTGFGGTTQRAETAAGAVIERMITVRFDANTAEELGWEFHPEQREIAVRMGEVAEIAYFARNDNSVDTAGTASFNVTPPQAGRYFNKISCFCFDQQQLAPGEEVRLPVVLFVDPEMDADPNLAHVDRITLSYTFFRHPEQPIETATLSQNTAGGG
jgi:cytochrome c oxidase assembly protein subunit 11